MHNVCKPPSSINLGGFADWKALGGPTTPVPDTVVVYAFYNDNIL